MTCIIIGLLILVLVATWVATQIVRNGSAPTEQPQQSAHADHRRPHAVSSPGDVWKNATTERHDFGDHEIGYEPLMSDPPPAPKGKQS